MSDELWNQIDNVALVSGENNAAVDLLAEVERMRALISDLLPTLERCSSRPAEAQEICRREGFVFDGKQGEWQKLAFTFYTMLATDASNADDNLSGVREVCGE